MGQKNNRICITLDADFHMVLALQGAASPSTIRIRIEGLRGPDLANLLIVEWPKMEKLLESGAVVTITERNIRSRPLPIQ
jgi:predicted nuclease of predicted toxin-antitoxin system